MLKGLVSAKSAKLMHSYHNVADRTQRKMSLSDQRFTSFKLFFLPSFTKQQFCTASHMGHARPSVARVTSLLRPGF